MSSMQSQIKRRMWKSAIARVKRLRDEGRKFAPIVKKEPSKVVWREDEGGQADPDTFSDNEPGLEDTIENGFATTQRPVEAQSEAGSAGMMPSLGEGASTAAAPKKGKKRGNEMSSVKKNQKSAITASKNLKKMRSQK